MIHFSAALFVVICTLIIGLYLVYYNIRYMRKELKLMIFGLFIGFIMICFSSACLYIVPSFYRCVQERISIKCENPTCEILEKTDDGTYILYDEQLKKLVFYRKE